MTDRQRPEPADEDVTDLLGDLTDLIAEQTSHYTDDYLDRLRHEIERRRPRWTPPADARAGRTSIVERPATMPGPVSERADLPTRSSPAEASAWWQVRDDMSHQLLPGSAPPAATGIQDFRVHPPARGPAAQALGAGPAGTGWPDVDAMVGTALAAVAADHGDTEAAAVRQARPIGRKREAASVLDARTVPATSPRAGVWVPAAFAPIRRGTIRLDDLLPTTSPLPCIGRCEQTAETGTPSAPPVLCRCPPPDRLQDDPLLASLAVTHPRMRRLLDELDQARADGWRCTCEASRALQDPLIRDWLNVLPVAVDAP